VTPQNGKPSVTPRWAILHEDIEKKWNHLLPVFMQADCTNRNTVTTGGLPRSPSQVMETSSLRALQRYFGILHRGPNPLLSPAMGEAPGFRLSSSWAPGEGKCNRALACPYVPISISRRAPPKVPRVVFSTNSSTRCRSNRVVCGSRRSAESRVGWLDGRSSGVTESRSRARFP